MMRASRPLTMLLGALVLLGSAASEGRALPWKGKGASRGTARGPSGRGGAAIEYVTASRAYLPLGTAEGITVGTQIAFRRRGQGSGSCNVDRASVHAASCEVKGALPRPGDAVEFPRVKPAAGPRVQLLAPVYSAPQLREQRAQIDEAPVAPLVEFHASPKSPLQHLRAQVDLTETAWVSATNPQGGFQQQRLDVAVRGAELGAGFQAFLDMTVLHWSQRSATSRFPLQGSTDVFVREAAVATRDPNRPFTLAVGRLMPWHTPGLGTLDGLQAGWHNGSGTVEGGLVAGALPDAVSTAPGTHRSLVAAYLSGFWTDVSSSLRWLETEVVLSAQQIPSQGWHYAFDGLALGSFGKVADIAAELRAGAGVVTSADLIEAARLDFSARPDARVRIAGGVRYVFDSLGEVLEPGALTAEDHALHASGSVTYDLSSISVGGTTGFSRDFVSGLNRGYVGPELAWASLFGRLGGLAVGYQEYLGWIHGRDGYGQVSLAPGRSLRLLGRLSYSYTDGGQGVSVGSQSEVGSLLQADLRITGHLALRASLLTRLGLQGALTSGLSVPLGLVASGGVSGFF